LAAGGDTAGNGSASLHAAHARLLHDRALQFDFTRDPNFKPPNEPEWLKAIGRFLAALFTALQPVLMVVFWVGVGLAVALVIFLIVRELSGVSFQKRRRARARATPADWRPEAWKARALLEDADRLAAAGDYDQAVHIILYRSIEDIDGRRPRLVRPALTARDIAAHQGVPDAARVAFSLIARVVEASFFGGRPVDREGFAECRRAYEAFAFPEVWA
jgi:hypothetical protein